MLLSTMIESSDMELGQMLIKEASENVAFEIVDPSEAHYDAPEGDNLPDDDGEEGHKTTSAEEDGVLSDDDRGDKVEIDRDDDDVVNTSSNYRNADDENDHDVFAITMSEQTFREDLKEQIDVLDITEEERYLAHYLIDCLEDDGYLRRPLDELVDDLEFSQHHTTTEEDLEAVLVEIIQEELEPAGIGARDLRECLLLQARELKATPAHRLAYMVLEQSFVDFVEKHYDTIRERFGITSHQAWVEVVRTIRHLNPKPGNMQPVTQRSSEAVKEHIRPDFFVRNEDGNLVVTLNDGDLPEVRVSPEEQSFFEQLQSKADVTAKSAAGQEVREGMKFMRESIQRAQTFIECLEQRRNTMLAVMEVVVRMQQAFFLTGQVENLRPMTLEDIERQCEYDKSTISRVTSSKYADTEFGTIPLKSLFTNAVGDSTQSAIVDALKQVIEAEDKQNPFTDDALVVELSKQGYDIKRRTVQKYRQILGLGSAKERRES